VLHDVVRVDHEGGAQRDTLGLVKHAQLTGELAAVVGELPDRQLVQVGMVAAPGQFDEFVVGRTAQHHGVAVVEITRQRGELGDLGRADEGEVLRIEEDDLPLAVEAVLGDRLERRDAVLFVAVEARLHADDLEVRQFLTDAQHRCSPVGSENLEALSAGGATLRLRNGVCAAQSQSFKLHLVDRFSL
jgi:hypothetical protein